jgi:hypothetical protein
MTWTSRFQAGFAKPLIRQLVAFVQRDQRAALDWVGTGYEKPLADIVSYQLSPMAIPQFPGILIAPGPTVFDRDSTGSLKYTTSVYCVIALTHQSQDTLSELLQDYVRALDALFNTLPLSDFHSSWDLNLPILGTIQTEPIPATTNILDLWVASHTPEIRNARNKFAMAATIEIHLDVEEI